MNGIMPLELTLYGKTIQLDCKCKQCNGTGKETILEGCRHCGETGYQLTEAGNTIVKLIGRHLLNYTYFNQEGDS